MASDVIQAKLIEEQNADLRYKLAGSVVFDQPDGLLDSLSPIAYANAVSLLFIAHGTTVHVFRSADLTKLNSQNWRFIGDSIEPPSDSTEGGAFSAVSSIKFAHTVIHIAINQDETYVSAAYRASNDVFIEILQLDSFARVARIRLAESLLQDVLWNPGVPNSLATLSVDAKQSAGHVASFWEIGPASGTGTSAGTAGSVKLVGSVADATSVCFSPKGRLIVLGMRDGRLRQVDLSATVKREVRCALPQASAAVHVAWLTNFSFLVTYRPQASNDGNADKVCGLTIDKQGDRMKLTSFDAVCVADTTDSTLTSRQFSTHIREWRLVLVGSSRSHSFSTLVYSAADGNELDTVSWTEHVLDDDARPDLPMTDDYTDTQPLGVALVARSPSPDLFVLSNAGKLLRFNVLNKNAHAAAISIPASNPAFNLASLPKRVDLSAPSATQGASNSDNTQQNRPNTGLDASAQQSKPKPPPTAATISSANSLFGNTGFSLTTSQSTLAGTNTGFGALFASSTTQPKTAAEVSKSPVTAATGNSLVKPVTNAPPAQAAQKPSTAVQQQKPTASPSVTGAAKAVTQGPQPLANRSDNSGKQGELQSFVFNDCPEAVAFDGELRQVCTRIRQLASGEGTGTYTSAEAHEKELVDADKQIARFVHDARTNIESLSASGRVSKRDWLNLLVALDHVNALAALLDRMAADDGDWLEGDTNAMRLMASFRDSWLEQRARRLEAASAELADSERRLAELNARIDAEAARRSVAQRKASASASQSSVREQLARICTLNRSALATSRAKLDALCRRVRRFDPAASGARIALSDTTKNRSDEHKAATVSSSLPAGLVNYLRTREVPVVRCANSDALCSLRVETTSVNDKQKIPSQPAPATTNTKRFEQPPASFDPDHIASLTKSLINQLGEFERLRTDPQDVHISEHTNDSLNPIRTINGSTMSTLRPVREYASPSGPESSQKSLNTSQVQPQAQLQRATAAAVSPQQTRQATKGLQPTTASNQQNTPTALPKSGAPSDEQLLAGGKSNTAQGVGSTPIFGNMNATASAPGKSLFGAAASPLAGAKPSTTDANTPLSSASGALFARANTTPSSTTQTPTPATASAKTASPTVPANSSASSGTPTQTTASGNFANASLAIRPASTTTPTVSSTIAPNGSSLVASIFGSAQQSAAATPQSAAAGNSLQAPPASANTPQLSSPQSSASAANTTQQQLANANNTTKQQSSPGSKSGSLAGTTQQPAGSATSATQQPATAAGGTPQQTLFGSAAQSTAANPAPQQSLFGTAAQQPAASANAGSQKTLFGNTAQQPGAAASAAPQSSLFGSASQQPAAAANTAPQSSLFGSASQQPAAAANVAPQSSLFGSAAQQPATASNAAPQSSLFGSASQQPATASNAAPQSSLFGSASQQPATASNAAPQSSLFGNASQQPAVASNAAPQQSLFGSTAQQPAAAAGAAPQSSLFGSATQQPAAATNATAQQSIFGSAAQQQTATSGSATQPGSAVGNAQSAAAKSGENPISGFASLFNDPSKSSSLFGSASSTGGSSLFGSSSAGTSLFSAAKPQTQAQASPNVFGAATTQTQAQAQAQAQAQQKQAVNSAASFSFASNSGFAKTVQQSTTTPGGSTNTQSPFGSAPTSQPSGTSLFGGATANQSTTPNVFGGASANQTSGTSLFGGSVTNQTGGTSLFGGASTTQAGGTSLFGGASTKPAGTSLFGAAANQQQPAAAPTPSLFGGAQQAKPVFGQSAFGAAPAFGAPSTFGAAASSAGFNTSATGATTFGALFGNAQQQQQQTAAPSNQQQSGFGFAAMANATAPSFSNLANSPQTPAFGGQVQQSATSPSFTVRRM